MDPWDLYDPVDVLAKLPENFYEQLESKKWLERKESLQAFLDLTTANPKLDPKANYGEIVAVLKKVVEKDANINVAALGAKCVHALATGLRKKFQPHAAVVVPAILEKFKEKKPLLRDPLIECIDEVGKTIPLDNIIDDVVAAMGKPNPNIKMQTDLFLYRAIKAHTAATVPKKLVKAVAPLLVKHTGDSEPDVRDASYAALGAIMKALGEKAAMIFMADIAEDKLKMGKIHEARDKAAAESAAEEAAKAAVAAPAPVAAAVEVEEAAATGSVAVPAASAVKEPEIDPWDLYDPVDVLAKLPENFYEQLESKKWLERKESLQAFVDLTTANPKLDPKANYGEIVAVLKKVVEKDANINVAALAAKCIHALANGLRKKFQPHAAVVVPAILEKFKEKKPLLRDPLIECIDEVGKTIPLDNIIDDVVAAMGKPNPNIKMQTDLFLYRAIKVHTAATVPKKLVKAVAPLLVKHTGDSEPDVRDASYAALGAIMKALGEKAAMIFMADIAEDKLKMGKINEARDKAVAESPAPVVVEEAPKPQPKPAPAAAPPKRQTPVKAKAVPEPDEEEEKPQKQETVEEPAKPPPAPSKPKLFNHVPKGKASRMKDERSLKVLKWNFDAPTQEHIDQLKAQLGDVCDATTVQLLFHKDFKMHLKVLEQMQNFLKEDAPALLSNSDLLLKWVTLRFFDTNPAVLLRALDFSSAVLSATLENEETLSDQELAAFLPYVLLKSGEPKDAVRGPVKDIVQLLAELSSPAKVYPIVIEALKTKNSRQKAECLGMLENFIGVAGISVAANCQGSLKVIAACISDRDSGVRNGALNAIVAAYRDMGDRVFQATGKMNDKDKAMLDERIKRCGVVVAPGGKSAPPSASGPRGGAKIVSGNKRRSAVHRRNDSCPPSRDVSPEPERDADVDEGTMNFTRHLRDVSAVRANRAPNSGFGQDEGNRFTLDRNLFDVSDDEDTGAEAANCVIRDTSTMNLDRIEPTVRLRQPGSTNVVRRSNSAASITSIDTSEQIDKVIANMGSLTMSVASEAIAQLQHLLDDCSHSLIADRIDFVGKAVVTQLSLLRSQRLDDRSTFSETEQLLRLLCNFLTSLAKIEEIIQRMSAEVIQLFLKETLQVLCEKRITELEHGKWIIRSLNIVLMKMCEFADSSNFIVGAVNLVCVFIDNDQGEGKRMEFLHKCLYKQTEQLMKRDCSDLDLDRIIETLHEFMEKYPDESNPVTKASRKAIEVVVQRVVVATRTRISAHISRLPEGFGKITSYIKRCLRGIEKSNLGDLPGQVPTVASDMPVPAAGQVPAAQTFPAAPLHPSKIPVLTTAEIQEKISEIRKRREYIKSLFEQTSVGRSKSSGSLTQAVRAPATPVPATPSTTQKPKLKASEMASYRMRLEEIRKRREESPGPDSSFLNRTFNK